MLLSKLPNNNSFHYILSSNNIIRNYEGISVNNDHNTVIVTIVIVLHYKCNQLLKPLSFNITNYINI